MTGAALSGDITAAAPSDLDAMFASTGDRSGATIAGRADDLVGALAIGVVTDLSGNLLAPVGGK